MPVYKPVVTWEFDWNGSGSYNHPYSDVSADVEDYSLTFGTSADQPSLPQVLSGTERIVQVGGITGQTARGRINLASRPDGRYSAESNFGVPPSALLAPVQARLSHDGNPVWIGRVLPEFSTSLVHGQLLPWRFEGLNAEQLRDRPLIIQQPGSTSRVNSYGVPLTVTESVPLGVVTYDGPVLDYFSELAKMVGGWAVERADGSIIIQSLRGAADSDLDTVLLDTAYGMADDSFIGRVPGLVVNKATLQARRYADPNLPERIIPEYVPVFAYESYSVGSSPTLRSWTRQRGEFRRIDQWLEPIVDGGAVGLYYQDPTIPPPVGGAGANTRYSAKYASPRGAVDVTYRAFYSDLNDAERRTVNVRGSQTLYGERELALQPWFAGGLAGTEGVTVPWIETLSEPLTYVRATYSHWQETDGQATALLFASPSNAVFIEVPDADGNTITHKVLVLAVTLSGGRTQEPVRDVYGVVTASSRAQDRLSISADAQSPFIADLTIRHTGTDRVYWRVIKASDSSVADSGNLVPTNEATYVTVDELTPLTAYRAQASRSSSFPAGATVEDRFETLSDPFPCTVDLASDSTPRGVIVGTGEIKVSYADNTIRTYDSQGNELRRISAAGDGELVEAGGRYYLGENRGVTVLALDGTLIYRYTPSAGTGLLYFTGVTLWSETDTTVTLGVMRGSNTAGYTMRGFVLNKTATDNSDATTVHLGQLTPGGTLPGGNFSRSGNTLWATGPARSSRTRTYQIVNEQVQSGFTDQFLPATANRDPAALAAVGPRIFSLDSVSDRLFAYELDGTLCLTTSTAPPTLAAYTVNGRRTNVSGPGPFTHSRNIFDGDLPFTPNITVSAVPSDPRAAVTVTPQTWNVPPNAQDPGDTSSKTFMITVTAFGSESRTYSLTVTVTVIAEYVPPPPELPPCPSGSERDPVSGECVVIDDGGGDVIDPGGGTGPGPGEGDVPVIRSFTVSPASVFAGDDVRVAWRVDGTDNLSVTVKQGNTTISRSAVNALDRTLATVGNYTFTITASNDNGTAPTRTVTVEAVKKPAAPGPNPTIDSLTRSTSSARAGANVTIRWTTTNATSATLNGVGVSVDGSKTFTAKEGENNFVLVATNADGISVSRTIGVSGRGGAPTVGGIDIDPSGEQPKGTSRKITWTSTGATSATLNGEDVPVNGSATFMPESSTIYTLVLSNRWGTTSANVKADVTGTKGPGEQDPPELFVTVSDDNITLGESATIRWTTTGEVDYITFDGVRVQRPGGSRVVRPATAGTHRYLVVAAGPGGSESAEVVITVVPKQDVIAILTASDTSITSGESVSLAWRTSNATAASISGIGGVTPVAGGSRRVTPTTTTTYLLTAIGSDGTRATDFVTINVDPPVTLTVRFADSLTASGRRFTFAWVATGDNVTVEASGAFSFTGRPARGTHVYTLPYGSTDEVTFSAVVNGQVEDTEFAKMTAANALAGLRVTRDGASDRTLQPSFAPQITSYLVQENLRTIIPSGIVTWEGRIIPSAATGKKIQFFNNGSQNATEWTLGVNGSFTLKHDEGLAADVQSVGRAIIRVSEQDGSLSRDYYVKLELD